ncbi:MAG: MAPEG family protein [Cellvibrionaceae bacterium]|nr:MAPEG family protein [Cellvibrionaceae bacterium]MCV6628209.1 MAPEG family protein [Cellvibrionaceae bacterium]
MNSIALYMLLNLLLLVITKAPLAMAMAKSGGYDNANPREQQAGLSGWGKRALAAHQNALEAIPIFGLALLSAVVFEIPAESLHLYAIGFLVCRLAYQFCYLQDWATLRSVFWIAGYGFCIALVAQAL